MAPISSFVAFRRAFLTLFCVAAVSLCYRVEPTQLLLLAIADDLGRVARDGVQERALRLLLDVLVLDVAELALVSAGLSRAFAFLAWEVEGVATLPLTHLLLEMTLLHERWVEERLEVYCLAGAVDRALPECNGVEGERRRVRGDLEESAISLRARYRSWRHTRSWTRRVLHERVGRRRIAATLL